MKACRVDGSADMFQKAAVEGFYDTAMLSSVVADFVSERFGRRGALHSSAIGLHVVLSEEWENSDILCGPWAVLARMSARIKSTEMCPSGLWSVWPNSATQGCS